MAKQVTQTAATEHTRQFVKFFEKLSYRHSPFKVFNDFCAVTAISISNAVNFNETREQEYLKIMGQYNAEEREIFPKMLAEIALEMQPAKGEKPRYYDVLGELFSGLELHDSWKGQFFTPQAVSNVMALVTLGANEEQIAKHGYISTLEPCIGGGANVIGLVNAMFQLGYNPCKQLVVTGYDLDARCIHMSYVQLSLIGVPAMIQRRDTLSGETYGDYWYTPSFIFDDWAGRLRFERLVKTMMKILKDFETPKEKPVEKPVTDKPAQLTLF